MTVPKKDTEVWFFYDSAGSICMGFARAPIVEIVNEGEGVLVPCVALTAREAIDVADKLLSFAIKLKLRAKPEACDG